MWEVFVVYRSLTRFLLRRWLLDFAIGEDCSPRVGLPLKGAPGPGEAAAVAHER